MSATSNAVSPAIRTFTEHDDADAAAIAESICASGSSQPAFAWNMLSQSIIVATLLHLAYTRPDVTFAQIHAELERAHDDYPNPLLAMQDAAHDPELRMGWLDNGRPTPTHPFVTEAVQIQLNLPVADASARIASAASLVAAYERRLTAAP